MERDDDASDSRMGIDPDQLTLWMEVLDDGIMVGVLCSWAIGLSPFILSKYKIHNMMSP